MASEFDIRQSETRILQDQINSAAKVGMDSTLASINSELTPPGRLIAQATPNLVVTIGGDIVNPNTGKNRVFPLINNAAVVFAGGTITFPSTSGTITVTSGHNATITIGVNQFVAVLVQLDSTGNLNLSVSAAAASLGAVVVPGGISSFLSLGYIIVHSNGSSIIQSITNSQLYQFVGGSGSGSGASSGSKNYLSAITTSNSSGFPNPGNGNFELGSTVGWSLAHSTLSSFNPTSTATPGTAFDSTHGGSPANVNLSFTTVTGGAQISGLYSGDLASTTASVAGDMLISNGFFIDSSDEASLMSFSFHYKAVSGTFNFSGTSANTFAVWIYDVTNGAWIQPQGVYDLVQGSGVGTVVGTFQTTSNSTEYQIALININATSGAYTLYVDDFVLGPQGTGITAPIVTDTGATSWTPTGSWTTNTTYTGKWWRIGDRGYYEVYLHLSGTPNAVPDLLINMPPGQVIDVSKLADGGEQDAALGDGNSSIPGTNFPHFQVRYINLNPTQVSVAYLLDNASAPTPIISGSITNTAPATYVNGSWIKLTWNAPIVGWSSNSVLSSTVPSSTVALIVNTSTTSLPNNTTVTPIFTNVVQDTNQAYNPSTGIYTVPVSGYYFVTIGISFSDSAGAVGRGVFIAKNGTDLFLASFDGEGVGTSTKTLQVPGLLYCNAGDTINGTGFQQSGGTISLNGNPLENFLNIFRVNSGATTIAQDATVAAYIIGNNISNAAGTFGYNFGAAAIDTNAGWNGTTYTVPISGIYEISAQLQFDISGSGGPAAGQFYNIQVLKNNVQYAYQTKRVTGAATISDCFPLSPVLMNCNAGDTIKLNQAGENIPSITPIADLSWISIKRIK